MRFSTRASPRSAQGPCEPKWQQNVLRTELGYTTSVQHGKFTHATASQGFLASRAGDQKAAPHIIGRLGTTVTTVTTTDLTFDPLVARLRRLGLLLGRFLGNKVEI